MIKYINDYGKECWKDCTEDSEFDPKKFHLVGNDFRDDEQYALHTNLGSLTVVDRMTGFGHRDTETGFRDPAGKFWLASGMLDVRESGARTIGEAIAWVKKYANTCNPDEGLK